MDGDWFLSRGGVSDSHQGAILNFLCSSNAMRKTSCGHFVQIRSRPASEEKLSILTESNEVSLGTRMRPPVIYWILNPVLIRSSLDLWCGRERGVLGGGSRLASVVLYFPPSFLNFGNSLAAPVNFDVARVEIIMIKYSSLLLGQSENNYLHRCLL